MFVSGRLILAIDEYRVLVFPLPVGPVTSYHPPRETNAVAEATERIALEAELAHVKHELVSIQETQDHLLSEQGWQARNESYRVSRRPNLLNQATSACA